MHFPGPVHKNSDSRFFNRDSTEKAYSTPLTNRLDLGKRPQEKKERKGKDEEKKQSAEI